MNEIEVTGMNKSNGLVKGLGVIGAVLIVGGLAYKFGLPLMKKGQESEVAEVVDINDFREVETVTEE